MRLQIISIGDVHVPVYIQQLGFCVAVHAIAAHIIKFARSIVTDKMSVNMVN